MMNIKYKITKDNINWEEVAGVLRKAHLSDHTAKEQQTVFENSYAVVFVYDGDSIVGVARALSDGLFQAAIYNVALDEKYQGKGIGREMMKRLTSQLKGQNIILYTHPQTVLLYEKLGFRRAKTAMELFDTSAQKLEWLEDTGFFLPENYRFCDEYKRSDMKGPAWKYSKHNN
ncbi:GNAT family N-acetyltransferase [Butyrivibrio sp. AE3004]|uniref:GNAT family N-acetyltransferase n=1 Tax=Butyrivibrio sp. AE3004 TaxID=1506994 RepID=UPI000AC94998|nr:GNAT family N-acetyltransferase [Butyrivibrio sp. AE3004]